MLLFQTQPVPYVPYAYPLSMPSLTPQYLTNALQSLTPQTYLTTLRPLLDSLQNTSGEKQVAFGSILRQVNASLLAGPMGRTELQRALLYELATAVAPAMVAQEAKNDYAAIKTEADKSEFRKKYGYYSPKSRRYEIHHDKYNNCRQYGLGKYDRFMYVFLSSEAQEQLGPDHFTVRKLSFSGRHKNFDYQAKPLGSPVVCFTLPQWKKLSATEQESYLTGEAGVAYVSYSLPKNVKKLIDFLQAGDLVSADVSIHTGNAHVGIYDGEKVINTGSPLYDETLKKFTRKSGTITVRRLVTRSSTLLSAIPLTEGPNFWTQSIKPTSIPRLSDSFMASETAPAPLKSGKKK